MKLTAREFINKAEGLKASEMSVRQRLESIKSNRQSIQNSIETQEYRLDSLYLELQSLQSEQSSDEDGGTDNSSAIASVRAEISSTRYLIREYEQQDAELRAEEMSATQELRSIEQQEQETLAEIQDSAVRTNQNIALISSFGGDYANVSSQASNSFQHNLGQLSQAAQILGGHVSVTSSGLSSGSANAVSGSSASLQKDAGSGNFYESANNQRKSGARNSGSMGARSSGSSSTGRNKKDVYVAESINEEVEAPKKSGGFGKKITGIISKLTGKENICSTVDFDGYAAHNTGENRWHIAGTSYDSYKEFFDNMGDYQSLTYPNGGKVETIDPNMIEGITISSREIDNPSLFWSQHKTEGTKESFVSIAKKIPKVQAKLNEGVPLNQLYDDAELGACASIYFNTNSPSAVRVLKGDGFYEFESNGRHRILAARAAGYNIPVVVVGEIISKKNCGLGRKSNDLKGNHKEADASDPNSTDRRSEFIQRLQADVKPIVRAVNSTSSTNDDDDISIDARVREQQVDMDYERGLLSKFGSGFQTAKGASASKAVAEPNPRNQILAEKNNSKSSTFQAPRSLARTAESWTRGAGNTMTYNTPFETGKKLDFHQGKVQNFEGTCGLVSCVNVLRMAGVSISEADVVKYASTTYEDNTNSFLVSLKRKTLCTTNSAPSSNGGTSAASRKKILDHFGIPSCTAPQSIEAIAQAVSSGHGVIVSVHAETLYFKRRPIHPDLHAITITSVQKDNMGKILGFYVCDSNSYAFGGTGTTYYTADEISEALSDRECNITTTIIR